MKLYHLSLNNLDGMKLTPRVPNTILDGFEDNSIKRICFSSSIRGCVKAINCFNAPKEYFVHIIDTEKTKAFFCKPTKVQVPDCEETREHWCLSPIKVKCVGVIKTMPCGAYRWVKNIAI